MTDAGMQDTMPAPALQRRDDMGRIVAVTWHGAGVGATPERERWLVAVDGSECSVRAASMVARLVARVQGAEVDLVHVQPWLNKEAAESELPRRGWAATAEARQLLGAAAVRWRVHALMGEEAPEIAGLADALGSCGIAIGSQGWTATESLLLGSVAYQVVHLTMRPVLIVP